jgi:hypothetical protein
MSFFKDVTTYYKALTDKPLSQGRKSCCAASPVFPIRERERERERERGNINKN